MWQDLTVAWRFLLKRPIPTAIAVFTLGVTIATSTMSLGAIDRAFWRSAEGDRGGDLVTVYSRRLAPPFFQTLSYADYVEVRDRLRDAVDLAALVRVENTLTGGQSPVYIWGEIVSSNYFPVLDARPFLGRFFNADEDSPTGGEPVVVLGHGLWQRAFNSDPSVIGRSVRLGRNTVTIVGVAAPGFHSPAWPAEYWMSMSVSSRLFGAAVMARPDAAIFQTIGRLAPGTNAEQTRSRVATVTPYAGRDGWQLDLYPGAYLRFWPAYRSAVAQFLGVFAGLALCILIIACANLAGLLLARAGERQRELAIRQALGASRRQLARRLVAEAMILTLCGGAVGLVLVMWCAPLVAQIPLPVPATIGIALDVRLVAILSAVSLAASLLFTTLAAWKGLRTDPRSVLAASAVSLAPASRAHRLLVIAQVALCCVMLTVGGLLVRSAWEVEHVDVGFSTDDVVLARVALYDQNYTAESGTAFYEALQDRLSQLPDLASVALGTNAPVSRMRSTSRFTIAGAPDALQSRYSVVGPGYFETLGVGVLRGREFDRRDRREAEPVAIVNAALAARFSGGALGQTLRIANETAPRRIVGVVKEIKYNGITEPSQPYFYLPLAQAFRQDVYIHLRTRQPNVEAEVRNELRRLDPNVALTDVRTLHRQMDEALATPRASASASSAAAAIAVLLALVGIYGVLMTAVEQRQREFAIRSALGASPSSIVAGVVREGLTMTLVGVAIGTLVSFQVGRLVSSLLFEVAPRDPVVMVLVPIGIVIVSGIAWWAPSRRAAAVDPATLLRS